MVYHLFRSRFNFANVVNKQQNKIRSDELINKPFQLWMNTAQHIDIINPNSFEPLIWKFIIYSYLVIQNHIIIYKLQLNHQKPVLENAHCTLAFAVAICRCWLTWESRSLPTRIFLEWQRVGLVDRKKQPRKRGVMYLPQTLVIWVINQLSFFEIRMEIPSYHMKYLLGFYPMVSGWCPSSYKLMNTSSLYLPYTIEFSHFSKAPERFAIARTGPPILVKSHGYH